jgi:hypothetical protein
MVAGLLCHEPAGRGGHLINNGVGGNILEAVAQLGCGTDVMVAVIQELHQVGDVSAAVFLANNSGTVPDTVIPPLGKQLAAGHINRC